MRKSTSRTQKLPTPSSIQHPPVPVSTDFDTPYLVAATLLGAGLLLFGILLRTSPTPVGTTETPHDPLAASTVLEEKVATSSTPNSTTSAQNQVAVASSDATASSNTTPAVPAVAAVGGGGVAAASAATQTTQSTNKKVKPVATPIVSQILVAVSKITFTSGTSGKGKANGKK